MKLLTKLNYKYVIWSFVLMVFSGIVIYFTLLVIVNRQLDERLAENLLSIEKRLIQSPETVFFEPGTEVQKTIKAPETVIFSDTLFYNSLEKEFEEYRQIIALKNIEGTYYRIAVRKSKIESEDFLATLALVTILAMLLLTGILTLVNRRVAQSVWHPFFTNLKIIGQFSVNKQQVLKLNETGISEFDHLNEVVTTLTRKIITDFQNQKQFSEDISHELQTPLAIISSRLESLLGNPELDKYAGTLSSIYISVQRLAKLNKAMILLGKIENNQFTSEGQSNLKSIISEKTEEFSELIGLKNLELETDLKNDFSVAVPQALAEILVNNLLSNSINHNVKGGKITISIDGDKLLVCNSGSEKIAEPEKLFNRFFKANPSGNSVGLGLAIVKKICDLHGLNIRYSFGDGCHRFTVVRSSNFL